jgi:hypothetical protein
LYRARSRQRRYHAEPAPERDKTRAERLDRDWHDVVAGYNDMVVYENQVEFEKKQK